MDKNILRFLVMVQVGPLLYGVLALFTTRFIYPKVKIVQNSELTKLLIELGLDLEDFSKSISAKYVLEHEPSIPDKE